MTLLLNLLISAGVSIALYGMVAVGFSIIFSVTGLFHFAHAAIFLIGGYVAYTLWGVLPAIVAVVLGLAAAGALGAGVELGLYRPMMQRKSSRYTILMASLGLLFLLQGSIGAIWGVQAVSLPNSLVDASPLKFGTLTLTAVDLVTIATGVAVVGATIAWMRWSKVGRALLAVAEDSLIASTVGIPVGQMKTLACIIGTVVSVPSAIILAMTGQLTPGLGTLMLLYAFAAIIVGGIGSIMGTILGISILEAVSSIASGWLASYWSDGIAFAILLIFMVARPRGILGGSQRVTVN